MLLIFKTSYLTQFRDEMSRKNGKEVDLTLTAQLNYGVVVFRGTTLPTATPTATSCNKHGTL